MEYVPSPTPTRTEDLTRHVDSELQKIKFAINELYQLEDWHEVGGTGEPAFQNSWTNEGTATNETAAFRKSGYNVLQLKGLIDSGTIADGTVLFTLPAAYRPNKTIKVAGMYVQGSTENAYQLEIQTDGDVAIYGVSGASPVLSLHIRVDLDN